MLTQLTDNKRSDAALSAATIRSLNDRFRQNPARGRMMLTRGVNDLDAAEKLALILAVQQFTAFDAGNDPHSEHDFGAVEIGGQCFFWKIDYYDLDLQFGSPDPGDEAVTCRVMTIMRADEY